MWRPWGSAPPRGARENGLPWWLEAGGGWTRSQPQGRGGGCREPLGVPSPRTGKVDGTAERRWTPPFLPSSAVHSAGRAGPWRDDGQWAERGWRGTAVATTTPGSSLIPRERLSRVLPSTLPPGRADAWSRGTGRPERAPRRKVGAPVHRPPCQPVLIGEAPVHTPGGVRVLGDPGRRLRPAEGPRVRGCRRLRHPSALHPDVGNLVRLVEVSIPARTASLPFARRTRSLSGHPDTFSAFPTCPDYSSLRVSYPDPNKLLLVSVF